MDGSELVLLEEEGQLVFALFEGEPWQGRSPRALTRSRKALFLSGSGGVGDVFVDPEQLDFWRRNTRPRVKKRSRPKAGAAPTLLPLKVGRQLDFFKEFDDA